MRKRKKRKKIVCFLFLACLEKEEPAASPCQPRLGPGPAPYCRPRRNRSIYKVAPLTVSSSRRAVLAPLEALPLTAASAESGQKEECETKQDSCTLNKDPASSGMCALPAQNDPLTINNTVNKNLNQLREPPLPEVSTCPCVFCSCKS